MLAFWGKQSEVLSMSRISGSGFHHSLGHTHTLSPVFKHFHFRLWLDLSISCHQNRRTRTVANKTPEISSQTSTFHWKSILEKNAKLRLRLDLSISRQWLFYFEHQFRRGMVVVCVLILKIIPASWLALRTPHSNIVPNSRCEFWRSRCRCL